MEVKEQLESLVSINLNSLASRSEYDEEYQKKFERTMEMVRQINEIEKTEVSKNSVNVDRWIKLVGEITKVGLELFGTLTIASWVLEQERTGTIGKNLFAIIPKIKIG